MPYVLLFYYLPLSVCGLSLFGMDKYLARHRRQRIAERNLLLWSLAGAWPGALIGIVAFRHKSAKLSFLLKLSLCVAIHILLAMAVWFFIFR